MKTLEVTYAQDLSHSSTFEEVEDYMESLEWKSLGEAPWKESFPDHPQVTFKIGNTNNSILLKFYVQEKHIQGKYRQTNDPVHLDSCVEFFLSFDGLNYYNLEFNCMGTAHVGYGQAKHLGPRKTLEKGMVESIKTKCIINPRDRSPMASSWELLLNIPKAVFCFDKLAQWQNKTYRGNFYKCGDDLPEPHFLTWNKIEHPTPNFHLPEYFGKINFGS